MAQQEGQQQLSLPPGTVEVLRELEEYTTTVPDELTQHLMAINGCDCRDPQLARIVSLAGQRFLTSIVNDALQIARRKLQAPVAARRAAGYNPKDKRLVLAAEDVAEALKEYGVNTRSAPYFLS